MSKSALLILSLAMLLCITISGGASADFGVRECIKFPGTAGKSWNLPPSSGWKNIGYLTFDHASSSDYVVSVLLELSEGNVPGTEVEYQITLDGGLHGWYVRRVPPKYPTSQVIRSTIPNVPAGQHVLGVRARNLSTTSSVKYGMFWITPLLVEAAETTASQGLCNSRAVSSTWTDVLQVSATVGSGKKTYLDIYLETIGGTNNHNLNYRLLRGTTEIHRLEDSVPDVLRDGVHFSYVDKTPGGGTVTYRVQAQSVTGSTATFNCRSMSVQSVPQVTVFEASTTNVSVPSNGSWQTLAASPWIFIDPASRGPWGSDGAGFAHAVYAGAFNNEALLMLELDSLQAGWSFEVGVRYIHGSNTGRELESLPSDWEQLGLETNHQYRVELKARGLCSTTQSMNFARAHFQVLAIPDSYGYVNPITCEVAPWACCDQFPSQCAIYTCEPSGELSLVSVPGMNCPL